MTGTINPSNFLTAQQMTSADIAPRDYWIYPLLPKHGKGFLIGYPKHGKGHFIEQLGLCVSEKKPFLGKLPVESARVFYIELDSVQGDLKDRVDTKQDLLGFTGSKFFYKAWATETGKQIYLDQTATKDYDGIDTLDTLLTEYEESQIPINILIFDPFMKGISTGDEQKAFSAIARNIDMLLSKHIVSIIFVAHEPKYEYGDISQRILGTIKYSASADFIWELKARKEKEEIQGGTLKYTGKIPSGQFDLEYDRGIWRLSDQQVASLKTKTDKAIKLILDNLSTDKEESEIKKLALRQEISASTFQNALKILLSEGKVKSIAIDRNKRKLTKGL